MGRRKRKIDMLSGLPDEILHHILSFLRTKTSVSTSVLAKRWRFLWTHVPNLEFHGDDFRGCNQTQPLNIINRVVMLHEAKIVDTFSLRLSEVKGCAYGLETLINYPIKRGVRNLYLDFDFDGKEDIVCTFPRRLLTCKSLVDLKLVNCGLIPCIGELFLPSLKKLNLSYVEYEDDESLAHLISGCPVLEELIVKNFYMKEQDHSGNVIVSSPTIKTLNVDFSHVCDYIPDKMLIIDVPALIYLKVLSYDFECVKSLSKTMTSLIEAKIVLARDWDICDIDCTEHGHSIEFLSCLCHVRYLKISIQSSVKLFDIVGTGSMPKFVNLTKLELDLTTHWDYLVKFLEVADNLEVLFVSLYETLPYKEPKRVPPCMLSRLTTVRMYYISDCQDTFDMVRYILRNAQVLERMEISLSYRSSHKQKFDALQRISLFERVSKSCQVAFHTDEICRDMINMIETRGAVFY